MQIRFGKVSKNLVVCPILPGNDIPSGLCIFLNKLALFYTFQMPNIAGKRHSVGTLHLSQQTCTVLHIPDAQYCRETTFRPDFGSFSTNLANYPILATRL
jgi:hypothetical protein